VSKLSTTHFSLVRWQDILNILRGRVESLDIFRFLIGPGDSSESLPQNAPIEAFFQRPWVARWIFWGFCRNWFLRSPLHYLSSRSDFGFEFAEIFKFAKRLPAITDTGSRRLRVVVIRGVATSPHHWNVESPTPRIADTWSRRLPASPIRMYRWYWESSTPRTSDTVSHRLPISLSRRVANSAYHQYGESTTLRIVELGSRRLCGSVIRGVAIKRKKLICCRFSALLTAKPCL
jgi:hypothetical protein